MTSPNIIFESSLVHMQNEYFAASNHILTHHYLKKIVMRKKSKSKGEKDQNTHFSKPDLVRLTLGSCQTHTRVSPDLGVGLAGPKHGFGETHRLGLVRPTTQWVLPWTATIPPETVLTRQKLSWPASKPDSNALKLFFDSKLKLRGEKWIL